MAAFSQITNIVLSGGLVTSALVVDLVIFLLFGFALMNLAKPAIARYKLSKQLDDVAGDSTKHWFFGHTKQYPPSQEGLLKGLERPSKHPTMYNFWLAPLITTLNLYHSDTAISLLSSGAPKNEFVYGFFRPWIGDGLLTSKGKKWQRNRHLLTPAFHFNILKGYAQISNTTVATMLDKWKEIGDKPIDITDGVSLMTLDTMLKCAMSSSTNCQHVKNGHPYIKAVKGLARAITKRITTPYLIPDFIFWRTSLGKEFKRNLQVCHSHAEKIISERRVALQHASASKSESSEEDYQFIPFKKQLDFLDILLQTRDEDGKGLTDSEIRDEVDTFLFEGHDTTSSGISWALHNLAKYPVYQEKCRDEVVEVLGKKKHVEWSDLSNFVYLTMFIKESMRLYPPVVVIGRRLEEPMTLRSKLNKCYETVVPKGTDAGVHIFTLHRNKFMWEKPNEFDPERFTKENIAKRPPHAYLPFSAGSRNCIGQNFAMNEMKIALAKTLQRYRLYLDEETPEPVMEPRMILQSKDGIHIKIERLSD